jgi:hypothetical protein
LEGFLLNLLVVENKQQTTVGPILILPDGRAIGNAQQEEKATSVRFLEIPADRETLFSEGITHDNYSRTDTLSKQLRGNSER